MVEIGYVEKDECMPEGGVVHFSALDDGAFVSPIKVMAAPNSAPASSTDDGSDIFTQNPTAVSNESEKKIRIAGKESTGNY